jgi:hypothetical protein
MIRAVERATGRYRSTPRSGRTSNVIQHCLATYSAGCLPESIEKTYYEKWERAVIRLQSKVG